MPIYTPHAQCESALAVWRKCRDVIAGQEAMHERSRAMTYLPKLKGESKEDYSRRLARSVFFNATWRTIDGLNGMLFRKAPGVKVSAITEPMLADVTQSGMSLTTLAKEVGKEAMSVGRIGLLVDYPRAPAGDMTVQQAQALGMRPKMSMYKAEAITNWSTGWVAGRTLLTRLVLEECHEYCDPNDRFVTLSEARWRCLELVAGDDGLVVQVTVERKVADSDKGETEVVDAFVPLKNGKPLREIEFVFISADSTQPHIELPPLIDLVNMNISHYQSTSDVEHGAHKTALPQPYATGISEGEKMPTFYMGGGNIWLHPNPEGTFGMLEYAGQGLAAIETRIEVKERQMAVLGARMLEQQKAAAETAEVAGMHRSGEQSSLATMADTIDAGMVRALKWFDEWAGGTGDVAFDLNKEFLPVNLSAQELTALVAAWQSGGLSDQELFGKLQRGGVIADGVTFEEHSAQVENSRPANMPQPVAAPVAAPAE
ncbi:uncharacterized protein DUF4055 [Pseudoduganella lurida]|uniref:Uncharacterized protein DUF4055 n=1 Tax=Pseudoduganella lurida TaxID=1036180 RepID=A0A562RIZ9_9BURK|nr:DUF4055 domain-containing protein [Pseudoduganella lurida]TWI69048.1 uncharacterized protein DUF4055 [Pseudoduganella lurida]